MSRRQRYAGYYYDDETKNYYLQACYYNPANGSFLALDPHPGDDDEPLSQNGYTYGNNNPVMNVDPDGNNSKRIFYALATGMAFLLFEMAGTIKGPITALSTLIGFLVGYKDWKNAKEEKKAEVAKKMIKNSRMLKKKLVNEAKRALRKKGI